MAMVTAQDAVVLDTVPIPAPSGKRKAANTEIEADADEVTEQQPATTTGATKKARVVEEAGEEHDEMDEAEEEEEEEEKEVLVISGKRNRKPSAKMIEAANHAAAMEEIDAEERATAKKGVKLAPIFTSEGAAIAGKKQKAAAAAATTTASAKKPATKRKARASSAADEDPNKKKRAMTAAKTRAVFNAAGFTGSVNQCLFAAVQRRHVPLEADGTLDPERVVYEGPCIDCSEVIQCTVRQAAEQTMLNGGSDYEDGGEYAAVHHSDDCSGNYITGLCLGSPRFDCGKFHNHCTDCRGAGKCVGDYRTAHCSKCGKHYYCGPMGFECPCRERFGRGGRGGYRGGGAVDCVIS